MNYLELDNFTPVNGKIVVIMEEKQDKTDSGILLPQQTLNTVGGLEVGSVQEADDDLYSCGTYVIYANHSSRPKIKLNGSICCILDKEMIYGTTTDYKVGKKNFKANC